MLLVQVVVGNQPSVENYQSSYPFLTLKWTLFFGNLTGKNLMTTLSLTSFLLLMYSHVVSDFTILNVFQNSHTTKPLIYKIAGVWGNHEGSMLLWLVILAIMNYFSG